MSYRCFSLSDNSLTIEFGTEISVEINNYVLRMANFFDQNCFTGLIEIVPSYSSLTVFFDVIEVRKAFSEYDTAFDAVKNLAERALESSGKGQETDSRPVKIPVCFDTDFAMDLELVAIQNNLTVKDVIEIFLGKTYRVFMLGFLPGFAYMGEVDKRIATPRKQTPQLKIPAGSVGIAGKQTGIYPFESPGGWQIIGRTPLKLFTPEADYPTLLNVGDSIRFYRITKKKFNNY